MSPRRPERPGRTFTDPPPPRAVREYCCRDPSALGTVSSATYKCSAPSIIQIDLPTPTVVLSVFAPVSPVSARIKHRGGLPPNKNLTKHLRLIIL